MIKPMTTEEVRKFHDLLRSDPGQCIEITNEQIRRHPEDPGGYFDRHFAWLRLNQPDRALDDMNKVIELAPDQTAYFVRGKVFRQLGDYARASADFSHAEALDPKEWADHALTLLYQADCYARVGDEPKALACCARLPNDFWTPGPRGTPAGDKAEIADELRRIARG